ncbi:MAG: hypothetical protein JNN07_08215 [Verrucomicrobiales bacterium]|nr:hypothetical protein [Verrucomicrobiales bacterium]
MNLHTHTFSSVSCRLRGWSAGLAVAGLMPALVGQLEAAHPRVILTPSPGFSISWDGNNGGYSSPDAGASAPDNEASVGRGSIPLGSSELGLGSHLIQHINDGLYGNSHSWISDRGTGGGTDPDPFFGVVFPAPVALQSIAWGRDNGDAVEGACGGTCRDRNVGIYTLQFTQVSGPAIDTAETGDPATGWANIGTVEYAAGTDSREFSGYLRHRFEVSQGGAAFNASAIRIKVSDGLTCVDELEVNPPEDPIPPLSNFLVIASQPGFSIDWDGNNGKLNDPSTPALAPQNRASVSTGTKAFGSSELGLNTHFITNVNDGLYGNAHSWISANGIGGATDPDPYVGLNFGGLIELKRLAWSRDNGDVAGDCCGGTLTDRAVGVYTLQVTRVNNPGTATADTGDAATGWATVGTFEYKADGEPFTTALRHRYGLALSAGGGIPATGLRLKVSKGDMAIDEIEVNPFIAVEEDLGDAVVMTPEGTYSIAWDGNDGEYNSPLAGARAPAHDGLASRGAAAIGSSELDFGIHFIRNINDGFYGNSSSWISDRGVGGGNDQDPWVGLALGREVLISTLAWGRDNGDATEGGCGGTCTDRSLGIYTIQVTRIPAPDKETLETGDASTGWETVGTVDYRRAVAPAFNPSLRHSFLVAKDGQPIAATGVRVKVSDGNRAIDELEVNPSSATTAPPVTDLLVISPASGFGISWDRNDGDFANPVAGASAPRNQALATRGAVAFASSELDFGVHFVRNLNDGLYGNSHSWIPDFAAKPDANPFCGIKFAGQRLVRSIAWGRDNGDATESACGGTCNDRALGLYTLQFTRVENPGLDLAETGDAATGWETIGTVNYKAAFASVFNPHLRHRFDVSQGGSPLVLSALRIKVPNNQIAIDEIEVNPFPSADENVLLMQPEEGFFIEWDGNNGDFNSPSTPALAPDNDALASNGATAFGSSQLDFGVHFIPNINDGMYGNAHSWIADFAATADAAPAIGVSFGRTVAVGSIAWGRDNGDVAGDCCGGTLIDRAAGAYTLQFTQVESPNNDTPETGDPSTGWANIGRVTYRGAGSAAFRHHLRHEFTVKQNDAPIPATGIRLRVSSNQIAIDELEINTRVPVPRPVMSIVRDGNVAVLSWRGGGALEVAPEPTGPWTFVGNVTNPTRVPLDNPNRQFFRVR